MVTPNVGRIVHYWQEGKQDPLAAIVTSVSPNGDDVTLKVFWVDIEDPLPESGYTPQSKNPRPGHWTWPIFQRGA